MLTDPRRGRGSRADRSLVPARRSAPLSVIRRRTLQSVALVIIGAAFLGWLIGRQVTRRLVRLTQAADDVAATGRLDVEVPVSGSDETGRLGSAFNGMLGALGAQQGSAAAVGAGRGPRVAYAADEPAHQCVPCCAGWRASPPKPAQQLLDDLDSETKELTALVNELVELATDRRDDEPAQDCDLEVVVRTSRRSGSAANGARDHRRRRRLDGVVPARAIDRAVVNIIDNAAKFSDRPASSRSRCSAGALAVSDRGPGVPADDLPHIFDRFYRSVASRSLPGSGLGLAIVRDIVESHGGTVFAEAREGGGTTVGFTLPTLPTLHAPSTGDASPPHPPPDAYGAGRPVAGRPVTNAGSVECMASRPVRGARMAESGVLSGG